MRTIGIISANYISGDFGDLTDKRTLASIPFCGRYRLIDFTLSNMVNAGISTVGVISPYNSSSLIDHIGTGKPWGFGSKVGSLFFMPGSVYGVNMTGNRFLVRDFIANRTFLDKDDAEYVIISGSSDVFKMDYSDLIQKHNESGRPITAVCRTVEEGGDYRGFFFDTKEDGTVEKMSTKAEGEAKYFMDCFIVDRKFMINFIEWFAPLEYMDFMDIVSDNLDSIEVGTYEFKGYVGKVSRLQDYMNTSMDMLKKEYRDEIFDPERSVYTKVQDEPPVHYLPGSSVKNSIISAGCRIEGTVENSIIFRSTHIGKGAVIKNSVIMQHGKIGEGVELDNVVCDKYVSISDGVKVTGEKQPIVIGRSKQL